MIPPNPSREDVFRSLTELFHQLFDNESIILSDQTTAKDVPGWDSLNHLNLVIAVEATFKIKFKTSEVARMANVGEFADAILRKMSSR